MIVPDLGCGSILKGDNWFISDFVDLQGTSPPSCHSAALSPIGVPLPYHFRRLRAPRKNREAQNAAGDFPRMGWVISRVCSGDGVWAMQKSDKGRSPTDLQLKCWDDDDLESHSNWAFCISVGNSKSPWGLVGSFHALPLLAHLMLILARMALMAKLKEIDVNHLASWRLEHFIKWWMEVAPPGASERLEDEVHLASQKLYSHWP